MGEPKIPPRGKASVESPKEPLIKIRIADLKVGMFVVNLDRPWLEHPFLTGKKLITSEKQIAKLREYGIGHLYIDPGKGLDVSPAPVAPAADRPSQLTPAEKEQQEAKTFWEPIAADIEGKRLPPPKEVPFSQEIEAARNVQRETHLLIRGIMQDARMGKNIESEGVKLVVNHMIDSIFRNRDALSSLTRIKGYDEYTFIHSINVCILCLTMGRHMNFSREQLETFGTGALLHDVGKMKVPHEILNKPGKVTDEERLEINKHPLYSLEILEKSSGIPDESKQIALQHHERCNGQGYPYGLKGEEIFRFSQIAAIADVYDAMTTDRVYKKAAPPHVAIKEIYRDARKDFNTAMVERFVQCVGIYPVGTLVLLDTDEVGIVAAINPEKLLRPHVLLLFQNSVIRYPEPILVNLTEKQENSERFKKTIVMALDHQQWNIRVDDYLPGLKADGEGKASPSNA